MSFGEINHYFSIIKEKPGERALGKITKKELAKVVAEAIGCSRNQAYEMVSRLFEEMRQQLIEGNRIEVRGFGVLATRDTKARPGARNPRTGEVVRVPPRRKTHFKPGKELKRGLHQPPPSEWDSNPLHRDHLP